MTGVAYIRNCVKSPANLPRSLYLTEAAEMMKPKPSPRMADWKTSSGRKRALSPGPTELSGLAWRWTPRAKEDNQLNGEVDKR